MLRDKSLSGEFMQTRIDFTSSLNGCWLWVGVKTHDGYPYWGTTGNKSIYAHRFIYEQEIGPIPKGLTLDHVCKVRNCVNPAHMDPCTLQENISRGDYGWRARQTHCKKGHEFTLENTYFDKNGGRNGGGRRICLKCVSVRQIAYRSRKKSRSFLQHG
jgi:hypothetical protein